MASTLNGEVSQPSTSTASATSLSAEQPKTKLIFHLPEHQQTNAHTTHVTSITPFSSLSQEDQSLFKASPDTSASLFAVTTQSTIFHPQGGGQPSDTGHLIISTSDNTNTDKRNFEVLSARVSITHPGVVLHFGNLIDTPASALNNVEILQVVDAEKRKLYSRLHTAGHVLGAATRTLLEHQIENFDELKASHFPDSAACEFQGLIDGKWKPEVQKAVDGLVDQDAEVRIEWWTKDDFKERGLERLVPSAEVWREIATNVDGSGQEADSEGEMVGEDTTRIRVVNIVGAEVYPCGGTHVPTTRGCGKVTVRKIGRQKGNSKISYLVE